MAEHADRSAPRGGVGGDSIPRPVRARWAVVAPAVVGGLMLVLLGVSAGEALRPVREVAVVQAVHVQGGGSPGAPQAPGAIRRADAGGPPVARGLAAQAAGWVEADPFVVEAAGLAEGVVREVLVLEGDRVEVGQVLARLVSEDAALALRVAEAEVESATAAVAIAEADAEAAETDWAEPVERELGVAVSGAAVARARAELEQWPSLVEAERARLAEIGQRLERARSARSSGGANEIEVLTLEREFEAQGAVLAATRAREGVLRAELARAEGELRAAERGASLRVSERRELAARRGALGAARAALRMAEVRRDEAALRLARMEIVSPIAGVVQQRYATPGTRIMLGGDDPRGAVVATLYDPARLQVRVDVPLADAGGIVEGQACEVRVEVLAGVTLRGVVTRVGHEADIQKNTLEVKVRIIDPPGALRPEMLARVKFLPGEAAADAGGAGRPADAPVLAGSGHDGPGVLVPGGAIDRSGGEARVWTVRNRRGVRGEVRAEPVGVLGERDGLVLVHGGVRPGELLVARPDGLRDGMLVRVRPAEGDAGGEVRP